MPVEIVPRTAGPRGYSARPNYPQESQGIYSLLDQDQEVPEGMDPGSRMAEVRDLAVQVFEKMKALGMDTPMTSVDSIFQGLMNDPDAMSQAYEFVAPDFNEGLQNNLRMPSEEMMMQQGISGEQLQAVQNLERDVQNLERETMQPRMSVADLQAVENLRRESLPPGMSAAELFGFMYDMGSNKRFPPPSSSPMMASDVAMPESRPTMSERLLAQMSLKDE